MYEREDSPPFQTQNVKRAKDGGLDQKVQEQEEEEQEQEAEGAEERKSWAGFHELRSVRNFRLKKGPSPSFVSKYYWILVTKNILHTLLTLGAAHFHWICRAFRALGRQNFTPQNINEKR
jgi:hypothetical protein